MAFRSGPALEEQDGEIALSVVVPCFNDSHLVARHVPTLQSWLQEQKISHEIVICDDGSADADSTRALCETMGWTFVASAENQGKGAAVRRGMRRARGRFRVYTDADIPFEFETFDRALHYLSVKEFDLVAGDRTLEESCYFVDVPLWRRAGSAVFSTFVGRMVAGGWYDTQCGFKGFRAEVAEDLFGVQRVDRFAVDVELLYIALKRNYDIKRLDVRLRCQEGSSVRMCRDGLQMLWDVGWIPVNQALGRYRARPVRGSRRHAGAARPIRGDYQYGALHGGPTLQRYWHQAKLDEVAHALGAEPGHRVLDAGCGSGTLAARLAEIPGTQVLGVDANSGAVAFALQRFRKPNLTFTEGQIETLDLAEASLDRIACVEVIEHIYPDQALATLRGFRRALVPGGRLVISVPNSRSAWPAVEWILDHWSEAAQMAGEQHVSGWSARRLRALGEQAGLTLVESRTIHALAPWLSPLSQRWAERVQMWERHLAGPGGCLLLQVFERPKAPG